METRLNTVTYRVRWRRARKDTHWDWRRELVLAIIAMCGMGLMRHYRGEMGQLSADLFLVGIAAVGGAVIYPLGEFVWNWIKSPTRILGERITVLQSLNKQLVQEASERKTEIGTEKWQEMASYFKQVKFDVRADWTGQFDKDGPVIGRDRWSLSGIDRGECESFCRLAGARLLRSPHISRTLSDTVRSQTDNLWRWLYFLLEHPRVHKQTLHGVEKHTRREREGGEITKETTVTVIFQSIENLANVSTSICIECAANED